MFMMADFVEVVLVAGARDDALLRRLAGAVSRRATASTSRGGATLALPSLVVVAAAGRRRSRSRSVFFCWLQIVIRWTLPRFRYDQLMTLGWKGLLPLALANVVADRRSSSSLGERRRVSAVALLRRSRRSRSRPRSAWSCTATRCTARCALVATLFLLAVVLRRSSTRTWSRRCRSSSTPARSWCCSCSSSCCSTSQVGPEALAPGRGALVRRGVRRRALVLAACVARLLLRAPFAGVASAPQAGFGGDDRRWRAACSPTSCCPSSSPRPAPGRDRRRRGAGADGER